MIVFNT